MAFRTVTTDVLYPATGGPVQILSAQAGDVEAWIGTTNASIRIGASTLANPSQGLNVSTGTPLHVRIRAGEELWALPASSSSAFVSVLIRSI